MQCPWYEDNVAGFHLLLLLLLLRLFRTRHLYINPHQFDWESYVCQVFFCSIPLLLAKITTQLGVHRSRPEQGDMSEALQHQAPDLERLQRVLSLLWKFWNMTWHNHVLPTERTDIILAVLLDPAHAHS